MQNVTQLEWKDLIAEDKDAIIIDSRTPKEWLEGVQENAVLMDVLQPMKFEQDAKELDKNKKYYVYCRSGQRSIRACLMLEAVGIENTYNLMGGMLGWTGKTAIPTL